MNGVLSSGFRVRSWGHRILPLIFLIIAWFLLRHITANKTFKINEVTAPVDIKFSTLATWSDVGIDFSAETLNFGINSKLMKHSLTKKLGAYSAFSVAFLSITETNGQILYTNLNPDDAPYNDHPVFIDIDNNGTDDIGFYNEGSDTTGWNSTNISVRLLNTSFSFVATPGAMPKAVNYGANISGFGNWSSDNIDWIASASATSYYTSGFLGGTNGDFLDKVNKFFVVRKFSFGDYNYGWVRLSANYEYPELSPNIEFEIHDHAFNTVADAPLYAGETGMDCNPPFQLEPVSLSPTATTVKWQPLAGAEKYRIKYRKEGVAGWTTINVTAPKSSKKITGLLCDTDYEWKISSSCDGGATYSAYSDVKEFSTAGCRAMSDEINHDITIYPNPASETLIVDLDGISEATSVEIIDMSGAVVHSVMVLENTFLQIDLSQIPAGMYLLKVTGNNTLVTKKFIKQ